MTPQFPVHHAKSSVALGTLWQSLGLSELCATLWDHAVAQDSQYLVQQVCSTLILRCHYYINFLQAREGRYLPVYVFQLD